MKSTDIKNKAPEGYKPTMELAVYHYWAQDHLLPCIIQKFTHGIPTTKHPDVWVKIPKVEVE